MELYLAGQLLQLVSLSLSNTTTDSSQSDETWIYLAHRFLAVAVDEQSCGSWSCRFPTPRRPQLLTQSLTLSLYSTVWSRVCYDILLLPLRCTVLVYARCEISDKGECPRRSQRGLSSFPQHSLLTLTRVKRTGNPPNYLISTTCRGQNINLLSPTQSVKCWRLRLITSRHDITSKCQLNLDFPKKPSKGSLRVQVEASKQVSQMLPATRYWFGFETTRDFHNS